MQTFHDFLNPDLCECHPDIRKAEIDRLPFLASISQNTIRELYQSLHSQGLREGQEISPFRFSEGLFGVVIRGAFKVYRYVDESQFVVFEVLTPGDFFLYGPSDAVGLKMFSFPDQIASMTTSCFLHMGRPKLEQLLNSDSHLASLFLEELTERQSRANERFVHLMVFQAEQKLAFLLTYLHAKMAPRKSHPQLIPFNLTRKDLGAMAGTTLETTSRVLSVFEKDGLINTGRGWVEILDMKGLEERSHLASF